MNQRQATYNAVRSVLTNSGVEFTDGMNAKSVMTKELRSQVNEILCAGFLAGEIELKDTESNRAKLADRKALMEYVSGLQTNWLNKDERLNGGVEHEIKNPGSRAGTGDAQLKALRALRSTKSDPYEIAEIEAHIERRLTEIAKPKQVTVNFDDLPEELKAKYAVK